MGVTIVGVATTDFAIAVAYTAHVDIACVAMTSLALDNVCVVFAPPGFISHIGMSNSS